jgi:HSP20 family protein
MATPQQTKQTTKQGSNQSTSQGTAPHRDASAGATASARETQVPIGGDRDQSRSTVDQGSRATTPHPSTQQYLPPNGFNQRAASPFTLMRALTEEMDRLFEGFAFVPPLADPLFGIGTGYPAARSVGAAPQRNLASGATSRSPAVRSQGAQGITQRNTFFPDIEVLQRGDNLVVRADLPGIKKEDIRVDCEDGTLRLSGTRKEESTDEGDGYFHSERVYGAFARSIPLPKNVDQAACKAKFDNGVLEVTVPLPKEKAKSRQVEIQ